MNNKNYQNVLPVLPDSPRIRVYPFASGRLRYLFHYVRHGIKRIGLLLVSGLMYFAVPAQDLTHFSQNTSSFSGSVSTMAGFYNASGMEPRRDPFNGVISGNFNVNLKGFDMPFSFVYSNQNKSFRQPFNQFGLSPKYKWVTLHLGYRNVNFSKYVLGSHTFFGIGTELNPGKFRFGLVYGRLKRATNKAVNVFHPQNDTLSDYKRKMVSMKIGVGTSKNYFDINLLKAVDDSTSVGEEFRQEGIFPEANLVAGVHGKIGIAENLSFETEAAYSIYTANQNSAVEFDLPGFAGKIIPINLSTRGHLAVESKLDYRDKKGLNLGLHYRRIDPDYRSMGTYFIQNDVENYTLKTGFTALKNKMQVGGSIGLERNNLKSARNATTHKTIGSLNINYNPTTKFGITANYSNYSINQQAGRVQIADSVKLYQTNGSLTLAPHFSFQNKNKNLTHYISLTYTQMHLSDKNPQSVYQNNFTTTNNILSYNLGFAKSRINVSTSMQYNKIRMVNSTSTNKGMSLAVNKRLKKPSMSLTLNLNYLQQTGELQSTHSLTPGLNITTVIKKQHQIRFKINMITNRNDLSGTSTTEQFADLRYVFNF